MNDNSKTRTSREADDGRILEYTLYFSGLYPTEEQDKINLFSMGFYTDALECYCKKESERKRLINGIRFLAVTIKEFDELEEVLDTWKGLKPLISAYELRESIKPNPNLAKEFKNEVSNILDIRKAELDEKRAKKQERILIELNKTKEALEKEREFNDLLRKSKDNVPAQNGKYIIKEPKPKEKKSSAVLNNATNEQITLIINSAMYKHRDEIKCVFEYLNDDRLCKLDGKEFTAVALILYKTGYFTQIRTFERFKRFLAERYNREIPSYKQSQVKETADTIKGKINCLFKLPTN